MAEIAKITGTYNSKKSILRIEEVLQEIEDEAVERCAQIASSELDRYGIGYRISLKILEQTRPCEESQMDKDKKVVHVKRAGQTRDHTCHWPGCGKQCPPAMWGCKKCWFKLPRYLRDKIWETYKVGQEIDMTPSEEYLEVAEQVQKWIEENYPNAPAS